MCCAPKCFIASTSGVKNGAIFDWDSGRVRARKDRNLSENFAGLHCKPCEWGSPHYPGHTLKLERMK